MTVNIFGTSILVALIKGFVYIFFQASSGIRMDQNKGILPILNSKVFEVDT